MDRISASILPRQLVECNLVARIRLLPVCPQTLLLLLHLLQINERYGWLWRLLRPFDEHAPVFGNGQFSVEGGGWSLASTCTAT